MRLAAIALAAALAAIAATGADAGEIEKLLKQAVAGNPVSVSAHSALINFYMRSRNFSAALGAAQAAQAALPGEPRTVQAVGMTQLAAGQTRQALASSSAKPSALMAPSPPHRPFMLSMKFKALMTVRIQKIVVA